MESRQENYRRQKTETEHGIEARQSEKAKKENPTWNRGKIITEGKRQKAKVESRQDYYRSQHAIKAPQFQNKILNNNNKI